MPRASSGPAPDALYRSGAYADANPDWHDADAPAKVDGLSTWLARLPTPPGRVLEVGCGAGRVLAELAARWEDRWPHTAWEGWDIAPEAIRRAQARSKPRLRYRCGDALTSAAPADLCLTIDVIEHVADDEGFLAAVAARAPWHLLRIPLDLSALDVVRPARLLAARERYGHRHFYTRDLALDRMDRAGLQVVGTGYHHVPFPPTTWRQLAMKAIRRGLSTAAPHLTARLLGGVSLLVLARRRGTE